MNITLDPVDIDAIANTLADVIEPHIERIDNLTRIMSAARTYPQFMNEKQVAEMTSIPVATLRNNRLTRKGIPYIKNGGSVYYDINDVIAYMQARKVTFD